MNDDDIPRRGRDAAPEPSSAGDPEPRAAAPRAPSPAATSRVPRPLRWLVDDVGLKLLAFVLAVSTWALVRNTQLQASGSVPDVSVEIEIGQPDVRILSGGSRTTKVNLAGTTGAVQRAQAQLEGAGRRIRLRVHDLKGPGGTEDFAKIDDFTFPIEGKQVVTSIEPPIRVKWTRIESIELKLEQIAPPEARTGGGYFEAAKDFPAFDTPTATITVTGPTALIKQLREDPKSLFPDPVDAQAWLKLNPDLTTLFPWTCGFSSWRAEESEARTEALVTITPATVSGKLKVREAKLSNLKADVALLYPPGVAPGAYDAFEVKILDTGYDARTRRLDIAIKGDAALVTDRKNPNGEWTLVVALPAPPADGAPDLDNASAQVRLVSLQELPTSDAKPRLRLVGPTSVFVSITRKKS